MTASILRRALLAVLLSLPAVAAQAQTFTDRPVRFIVPFGPGSGTDLIARALAKGMTDATGANIIIDNRPGGEGFIGSQAAESATPDGYTLLMAGSSTQVVNVHFFEKLPYDPIKGFVPVAPLAETSMLLTVNTKLPAKSIGEFLKLVNAKPGTLSFGTGSATTRLAGLSFERQAGLKMLEVPYKTPAQAVTDLLGGQVDMFFIDLPTIAGHLQSGRLRSLASSGRQRMRALPDIPTLQESGLKNFDLTAWYGIWAPAGTPSPAVHKLHDMIAKAMALPSVRSFFDSASMDSFPMMTPEEFQKFQLDETARLGRLVKAANIAPR